MTTGGEVVVTGYVEVIGLLYTVMRNEQGACVSIPNKARLPATFRCAQHCSLLLLLQPAFALVAVPFRRCAPRRLSWRSFRDGHRAVLCQVDSFPDVHFASGESAAGWYGRMPQVFCSSF